MVAIRVDFLVVVKFLSLSNKQLRTHGKNFQGLAQTLIVESGDEYIYGSSRFANICVVSVNKDNCPHRSDLLTAAVTQLLALMGIRTTCP